MVIPFWGIIVILVVTFLFVGLVYALVEWVDRKLFPPAQKTLQEFEVK